MQGSISFVKRPMLGRIAPLTLAMLLAQQGSAWAATTDTVLTHTVDVSSTTEPAELPVIQVKASKIKPKKGYQPTASNAATRLNTSAKDTAQSLSSVGQQQLQDFQLTSVNQALAQSAGVLVEGVETDRTYYTSRGFDITNFQVDGTGVPMLHGNIYGSMDLALYERLDILSGANGLTAIYGDPSATVNFVRKRPTHSNKTTLKVSAGSWEAARLDVDSNVVINDQIRARGIAATSTTQSYLDRYGKKNLVLGGVVAVDVTDQTLLTVGVSHEDEHTDSPMWGALPVVYADGSPHHYSRATSSSSEWAYWDNLTQQAFMELNTALTADWSIKTTLSQTRRQTDSSLFYVYGNEDKTTGQGLKSYPSRYDLTNKQSLMDVTATGAFDVFGQRHDLALGAQWSRSTYHDLSYYDASTGSDVPALEGWNGQYPNPTFTAGTNGSEVSESQTSLFGVVKWTLTDDLRLTTGARVMDLNTKGTSYGVEKNRTIDHEWLPYAGLVYDLTPQVNVYGSVAKTFTPQAETDITLQPLDPKVGLSYEVGLKAEVFDAKALATLALFKTAQDHVAIQGGTIPNTNKAYYISQDGISTEGVELQLAGTLAKGLDVNASYTHAIVRDKDDVRINPFTPKQFARLTSSYQLPQLDAVKVGASVRWQDDIYGQTVNVKQPAYVLVDVMAQYQINPALSASLNINNVTNEKYWKSLYWAGLFGQAYYGAPREVKAAVTWSF